MELHDVKTQDLEANVEQAAGTVMHDTHMSAL